MKRLSMADYYLIYEKIERKNKKIDPMSNDPRLLRAGILGNFTLNGIKEALSVKCDKEGFILKSCTGEYNQYNQEILNSSSRLYSFKPHLVILFLDIIALLGEDYGFPYRLNDKQRKALVKNKIREILHLTEVFKKHSSGKLLLHNFNVPAYSPMGLLETKQRFGFFDMVRSLNHLLKDHFRDDPQVYVFDYDGFLSKLGKSEACDEKMRYMADMRLGQNYIPVLCDEYMRYIKALKGKIRKCLVLDLDNTLWGGIVGEDGFEGINLSSAPPGNSFIEFQKYILNLFERGTLLAINSSNNEADAMKVIREHPGMILKENHFASIKINWNNKAKNMADIAKELNVSLDSLIYIEDDKRNRELIRELLPQVMVLELPEDPALYIGALQKSEGLDVLQLTDEDKKRGHMYAEERRRKEIKTSFNDIAGFLKHLDIRVRIDRADNFSIPRISQLTQRTNQFNLTTRRYSEEDIQSIAGENNHRVYSISVKDRFGDGGISGAIIMKREAELLILDNFLLSCRILGKDIEKAVMSFCVDAGKKIKARYLVCEYIKSGKNEIARKFLETEGFKLYKRKGQSSFWKYEIKKGFERPKFIKVSMK